MTIYRKISEKSHVTKRGIDNIILVLLLSGMILILASAIMYLIIQSSGSGAPTHTL